jgi:hypothetical protein
MFFSDNFFNSIYAQTEMQPWGHITGIRVDGQLREFETSLQVDSNIKMTERESNFSAYNLVQLDFLSKGPGLISCSPTK